MEKIHFVYKFKKTYSFYIFNIVFNLPNNNNTGFLISLHTHRQSIWKFTVVILFQKVA